MPLTVGGGIRTLEYIRELLQAGADKVSLNTAAVQNPDFVGRASEKFGSQCIVVAIDAKRKPAEEDLWPQADRIARKGNGHELRVLGVKISWEVYIHGGPVQGEGKVKEDPGGGIHGQARYPGGTLQDKIPAKKVRKLHTFTFLISPPVQSFQTV